MGNELPQIFTKWGQFVQLVASLLKSETHPRRAESLDKVVGFGQDTGMDIRVRGASEHNLRSVDVDFGDGLTVITGVSGSGKSSLVFDIVYHEARRRFLEVYDLSGTGQRLQPARVRAITGLGPAVAVGQNLLNRNPNSTLATAAGLHPFLRVLFAAFGRRHCPRCDTPHALLAEDEIVAAVLLGHEQARHADLGELRPELAGAAGLRRRSSGARCPRQPSHAAGFPGRYIRRRPASGRRRSLPDTASAPGSRVAP